MKYEVIVAKTILKVKDAEVPNRDAEALAIAYLDLLEEKKALEKVLEYHFPSITKEVV